MKNIPAAPSPHAQNLAHLSHKKIAVFTRRGELLWRSSAWTGKEWKNDPRLAGAEWHEFVHTKDLASLLRWFANGREGRKMFRMMLPQNGRWARVAYAKIEYGRNWLVVGNEDHPFDEEPPALEMEFA